MEIAGLIIGVLGLGWGVYAWFKPRPEMGEKQNKVIDPPSPSGSLVSEKEVRDWYEKSEKEKISELLTTRLAERFDDVDLSGKLDDLIIPFSLISLGLGAEIGTVFLLSLKLLIQGVRQLKADREKKNQE